MKSGTGGKEPLLTKQEVQGKVYRSERTTPVFFVFGTGHEGSLKEEKKALL